MNFDSSFERYEVKDRSRRRWTFSLIALALACAIGGYFIERDLPAAPNLAYRVPNGDVYRYAGGIRGPSVATAMHEPDLTPWRTFASGGPSRLAILLTDPNSDWLGLAHGLKAIGVPFTITTVPARALEHRVVIAYPVVSGKVLSGRDFASIDRFVKSGGTFVGFAVLENELGPLFGFKHVFDSKDRTTVDFNARDPLARQFRYSRELHVRFSDPADPRLNMGSYGYTGSIEPLVAAFNDGTGAIVRHHAGAGETYAIGLDVGAFLLEGYNNREEHIAHEYVNAYEPALDVFMRLIRALYVAKQPNAVTLGTVPQNKRFSAIISHDVDSWVAIGKCLDYARAERRLGVPTTYFIQTKYVRDYNDVAFFDDKAGAMAGQLERMGMEVASHSVSHSRQFSKFPLGSGREAYPDYVPFIKDPLHTYNGTIMGELRVSKFILEHFTKRSVVSFRPGDLSNPFTLPEDVAEAGYRFTSATTADDSLTHLPFQLDVARSTKAQVPVFEIPITIEDEALPRMDRREPAAEKLTEKIAGYGGVVSILIHPNVTSYKLSFEQRYVRRYRREAYFGTYRGFGSWWAARDALGLDAVPLGRTTEITVTAPLRIEGLPIVLAPGTRLLSTSPRGIVARVEANVLVLRAIAGTAHLTVSQAAAPARR